MVPKPPLVPLGYAKCDEVSLQWNTTRVGREVRYYVPSSVVLLELGRMFGFLVLNYLHFHILMILSVSAPPNPQLFHSQSGISGTIPCFRASSSLNAQKNPYHHVEKPPRSKP
ncbi:hypothetical protein IEQ34_015657 [Dendrobium chrysotoxum]|uniref:Uncharacterized protein n=1 Tax=Dendrobium chrysotoxum TaxID=161865 RepID=A0AAV7G0N1_DENCH|nr:hypothetical protein IEQ34_015657 [Dendrobium chrysotoxum]